eukprot:TRINITY_DN5601_c0_g2_i1.p1 TRINITY_DN5601_c0_g2~~TRINITY_DN5601_c0_g2_i1.p1  ORF type:complete len:611 (-),score=86.26 TRINITY_DN5601_c0_g2_i1:205-2037(-)
MVAQASVFGLSVGRGPGGYKLLRILGRGSFGEVWEACSPTKSERLALKLLDLSGMGAKERHLAFQEARLMRRLSHPHVIRFVDLIVQGSKMSIVMQHMEGGDMCGLIERMRDLGRRFQEVDLWRWLLQVNSALQYLHAARIIHRDVKPGNIFLSSNGGLPGDEIDADIAKSAVLGDLGIAKVLAHADARTATQIGTPAYLAPEVWLGRSYNYAADIFSLGCTLYELAELRLPFEAKNNLILGQKACHRRCPPIRGGESGFTPSLQFLVQLMMEKDANARPSPDDILSYAHRLVSSVGNSTEGANMLDLRARGVRSTGCPAAVTPVAALLAVSVDCGALAPVSSQPPDTGVAPPLPDADVETTKKIDAVSREGCVSDSVFLGIAVSVDKGDIADSDVARVPAGRPHAVVDGSGGRARKAASRTPRCVSLSRDADIGVASSSLDPFGRAKAGVVAVARTKSPPMQRPPASLQQPRRLCPPLRRASTPRGHATPAPFRPARRVASPSSVRAETKAQVKTKASVVARKASLPLPPPPPSSPPPLPSPRMQKTPPEAPMLCEETQAERQRLSTNLLPFELDSFKGWGDVVPWRDRVDVSCFQDELSGLDEEAQIS